MEHRLHQELVHFETTVASLRASQAEHYEDMATEDAGQVKWTLMVSKLYLKWSFSDIKVPIW